MDVVWPLGSSTEIVTSDPSDAVAERKASVRWVGVLSWRSRLDRVASSVSPANGESFAKDNTTGGTTDTERWMGVAALPDESGVVNKHVRPDRVV